MKILSRPQAYRVRRILEMIRQGTSTGRLPNATDFSRELEMTRQTVQSDLNVLRDDHRAPIEYDPRKKGYRLADLAWLFPPVTLDRSEVFAFSVARKILAGFRGTPLELDLESVCGKIAEAMQGRVTMEAGDLTERISVLADDYVRIKPETWSAIAACVDRSEQTKVVYQRFDGVVGTYVLDPYHLVAYHGNWYVLAGRRNKDVATFAVSRVRSLDRTGVHFQVPRDFDPRAHLQRAFGIARGERAIRVRLRFSRRVATYIGERTWHPDQTMRERKNGDLELTFETAGWKELVRWILSWQPDVKVIAPKRLRERVEEKMRQGLGLSPQNTPKKMLVKLVIGEVSR